MGLLFVEITTTIQFATRKKALGNAIRFDMQKMMQNSQKGYSVNLNDTQMWDEIQLEVILIYIRILRNSFKSLL